MKVGDYARTKEGNIYKIAKLGYNNETFWSDTDDGWFAMYKSSPNIIDLIEVGDYVNGMKVINRCGTLMMADTFDLVEDEDIRTILTKECFKSMEYKLGE